MPPLHRLCPQEEFELSAAIAASPRPMQKLEKAMDELRALYDKN